MKKTFYVTSPIYYVNDKPHIGHGYTSLACDIMTRFKKLDNYDSYFLTGTDEHGQKVEKSALANNVSTKAWTDKNFLAFKELANKMNFSYDDFIRTTEERHKKTAQFFWQKLEAKGYIYKSNYKGWYSIRDECYYNESELIRGKAPTGAEVKWIEEESYFFKLSEFQDRLLELYENNPDFIAPKSRYNEVVSFVRGGKKYQQGALKDLSISRTSFSWGLKVPNDKKHIMYVWLDALVNYLSALDFINNGELYKKYWPCDVHIVGKDIIRFHSVYWPAFLMAIDMELPKKIFAHGWWTNEGEKISKSLGNVIDILALAEEFGVDKVRYFLMKEMPFGQDGDFSKKELIRKTNSDLANNLGNLTQRICSFVQKNCDAKIPKNNNPLAEDKELLQYSYNLIDKLREYIDNQQFHKYIEKVIELSSKTNEYIDKNAPWHLKKTDTERMENVLYVALDLIRVIAIYFLPIIPNSSNKILDLLAVNQDKRCFSKLEYSLQTGINLPEPKGLFARI